MFFFQHIPTELLLAASCKFKPTFICNVDHFKTVWFSTSFKSKSSNFAISFPLVHSGVYHQLSTPIKLQLGAAYVQCAELSKILSAS
jgi:hypothetical protein